MKNTIFTIAYILVFSSFIFAQNHNHLKIHKQNLNSTNFNKNIEDWVLSHLDSNSFVTTNNLKRIRSRVNRPVENKIQYNTIANLSTSQIIYNDEIVFNQDSSYAPDIVCLDETHFVIVYPDTTQNRCGIVMTGTIYPDSVVLSEKVKFHNSSVHNFIRVEALTPTRFVIGFIAGSPIKGYAIIGDIDDNSITLGPTCIFNPDFTSSYLSVSPMTDERIVISFLESENSTTSYSAMIGTIESDSITFSDEYIINSFIYYNVAVAIDSNRFVTVYSDNHRGKAIIGTYSGGIIDYSNEFEFNNPNDARYLDASYIGNNKIAIVYTDYMDDFALKTVIATIVDDSIVYGEDYIFSPPLGYPSPINRYAFVESLDTSNFLISFEDTHNNNYVSCVLANILSDSINFSTPYVYNYNSSGWNGRLSKINSSHFLVAYPKNWNDPSGIVKVGNIAIENSISNIQTCAYDNVSFPILTKHVDGIIEFNLELSYDTARLIYTGYNDPFVQLNTGTLNIEENNGQIIIFWYSNEMLNIVEDTLLNLLFTPINNLIISNDSLTWDTDSNYFIDLNSLDVPSNYINGTYYLDPMVDSADLIHGSDSVYYGTINEEYTTSTITNASYYNWSLNPDSAGAIYGNDTSVIIDFSQSYIGTATLSVQGSNNCGDGMPSYKTIYLVDSFVNVESRNNYEPQIKIWPNPSSGTINVSIFAINQVINVSIYNSNLELIQHQQIITSSGLDEFKYDINDQSPGIYIIRLSNEEINLSKKIVHVK